MTKGQSDSRPSPRPHTYPSRGHDSYKGVNEVGVVGAGTMGAGVAQIFAVAGYPVRLQDIAEEPLNRGMGAIKKSLERLVARG